MGQEIIYCFKCQNRLVTSDFEKGKAVKIHGQPCCAACAPPGAVTDPPPATPRRTSTARIPIVKPDTSAKLRVPEARPSNALGILGAVGAAIALAVVVALASTSGERPKAPARPPEIALEPAIPAPAPPPPPPPPRPRPVDPPPPAPAPVRAVAVDLAEIDAQLSPLKDAGAAAALLRAALGRRSEAEWISGIELRLAKLRAPEPPTASSAPLAAFRKAWADAAAARTFASVTTLKAAAEALADPKERKEALEDVDALQGAELVASEAPGAIAKLPRHAHVRAEVVGGPSREGVLLRANAARLILLSGRDRVEIPIAELTPGTLADLWRRPESDGRAAGFYALLHGDAEGARRHLGAIPERYAALLPARTEAPEEIEARGLFWSAEADYRAARTRAAAVARFADLKARPGAFTARNRAWIDERIEAGRESFFLADDMTASGSFARADHPKVDSCLTSGAETPPAQEKDNAVEVEFYAETGPAYKAWAYVGACCLETFAFSVQATDLRLPNPKKTGEILGLEPGGDASYRPSVSSFGLRKSHQDHGGLKEPSRWLWMSIPLPKYALAGPKKVRLMTVQQGFSVAYVVIGAARRDPPRDAETKALERGTASAAPAAPPPAGSILREYWLNVQGGAVEDLTRGPAYAGPPSGSGPLNAFAVPEMFAEQYGQRIRGYVHPPATGRYVFTICSDDQSELWLSPDESPSRKVRIAKHTMSVNKDEWDRDPGAKSAPITLFAGKRYYVEFLHKDHSERDQGQVGWQHPDGTLERPIPGPRLSPFVPGAPPSGLSFHRAMNLNGPALTLDGNAWDGRGAANAAISGEAFEWPGLALKPDVDPPRALMIRSAVGGAETAAVTLSAVPAGAYQVYVHLCEPEASRSIDLFLDGQPVYGGYATGEAGQWVKLGPFPVTCAGGKIEIRARGANPRLSGVEVWKVAR